MFSSSSQSGRTSPNQDSIRNILEEKSTQEARTSALGNFQHADLAKAVQRFTPFYKQQIDERGDDETKLKYLERMKNIKQSMQQLVDATQKGFTKKLTNMFQRVVKGSSVTTTIANSVAMARECCFNNAGVFFRSALRQRPLPPLLIRLYNQVEALKVLGEVDPGKFEPIADRFFELLTNPKFTDEDVEKLGADLLQALGEYKLTASPNEYIDQQLNHLGSIFLLQPKSEELRGRLDSNPKKLDEQQPLVNEGYYDVMRSVKKRPSKDSGVPYLEIPSLDVYSDDGKKVPVAVAVTPKLDAAVVSLDGTSYLTTQEPHVRFNDSMDNRVASYVDAMRKLGSNVAIAANEGNENDSLGFSLIPKKLYETNTFVENREGEEVVTKITLVGQEDIANPDDLAYITTTYSLVEQDGKTNLMCRFGIKNWPDHGLVEPHVLSKLYDEYQNLQKPEIMVAKMRPMLIKLADEALNGNLQAQRALDSMFPHMQGKAKEIHKILAGNPENIAIVDAAERGDEEAINKLNASFPRMKGRISEIARMVRGAEEENVVNFLSQSGLLQFGRIPTINCHGGVGRTGVAMLYLQLRQEMENRPIDPATIPSKVMDLWIQANSQRDFIQGYRQMQYLQKMFSSSPNPSIPTSSSSTSVATPQETLTYDLEGKEEMNLELVFNKIVSSVITPPKEIHAELHFGSKGQITSYYQALRTHKSREDINTKTANFSDDLRRFFGVGSDATLSAFSTINDVSTNIDEEKFAGMPKQEQALLRGLKHLDKISLKTRLFLLGLAQHSQINWMQLEAAWREKYPDLATRHSPIQLLHSGELDTLLEALPKEDRAMLSSYYGVMTSEEAKEGREITEAYKTVLKFDGYQEPHRPENRESIEEVNARWNEAYGENDTTPANTKVRFNNTVEIKGSKERRPVDFTEKGSEKALKAKLRASGSSSKQPPSYLETSIESVVSDTVPFKEYVDQSTYIYILNSMEDQITEIKEPTPEKIAQLKDYFLELVEDRIKEFRVLLDEIENKNTPWGQQFDRLVQEKIQKQGWISPEDDTKINRFIEDAKAKFYQGFDDPEKARITAPKVFDAFVEKYYSGTREGMSSESSSEQSRSNSPRRPTKSSS